MKAPRRKRARKATGRIVFDSIRKPLAPPGHPLAQAKPEIRRGPRNAKRNINGGRTLPMTSELDQDDIV